MANNLGLVNQEIGSGSFADTAVGGGTTKVLCETVEIAALAAASVISVSKAFQGNVMVVDAKIVHDALGTGVTLKLGDDDDDDAIIVATAAATAGSISIAVDQIFAILGGNQLKLTTGGAEASGTVKIVVTYVNI